MRSSPSRNFSNANGARLRLELSFWMLETRQAQKAPAS
jgi:hypothetical protein